MDILAIAVITHVSGTYESQPNSLLFVLHVFFAGYWFKPFGIFAIANLAAILYSGMAYLEYYGLYPYNSALGIHPSPE